jgi:hypothetical protein
VARPAVTNRSSFASAGQAVSENDLSTHTTSAQSNSIIAGIKRDISEHVATGAFASPYSQSQVSLFVCSFSNKSICIDGCIVQDSAEVTNGLDIGMGMGSMYGAVNSRRQSLGVHEGGLESSPYIQSGSSRRSNGSAFAHGGEDRGASGTPSSRLSDAWSESWRNTLGQGSAAPSPQQQQTPHSNGQDLFYRMNSPSAAPTTPISPSRDPSRGGPEPQGESQSLKSLLRGGGDNSSELPRSTTRLGTPSPSVQRLAMGVKARYAQYTLSSLSIRRQRNENPDPDLMFAESRVLCSYMWRGDYFAHLTNDYCIYVLSLHVPDFNDHCREAAAVLVIAPVTCDA